MNIRYFTDESFQALSLQTLPVSISVNKSISEDDAETFEAALRILEKEVLRCVEILQPDPDRDHSWYFLEYSSDAYICDHASKAHYPAEFRFDLEITRGLAKHLATHTAGNKVTVPLQPAIHRDDADSDGDVAVPSQPGAIHPDDAKAIADYVLTASDQRTKLRATRHHIATLRALARFGRQQATAENPFSLAMLKDQEKEATKWVEAFCEESNSPTRLKERITCVVKAFCAAHTRAGQI